MIATRRPVCLSLHALPQPTPVAQRVIHDKENTMPILPVTSQCAHEDRLISPHATYVHTEHARDQLHDTAQHRYSCVEVCPTDVRTCLSEFARATQGVRMRFFVFVPDPLTVCNGTLPTHVAHILRR